MQAARLVTPMALVASLSVWPLRLIGLIYFAAAFFTIAESGGGIDSHGA